MPYFSCTAEADETYMGGRRKNMPKSRRQGLKGRGAVGKAAVFRAKNRTTERVSARMVEGTDAPTLQGAVRDRAEPGAKVFTNESPLKRAHKGIFHKIGAKHLQQYVNECAGPHNVREADTIRQMESVVTGWVGTRLMYSDLIAANSIDSGARP